MRLARFVPTVAGAALLLAAPAAAQESRTFREDGRWVREVRGVIPAASLPIRVDTDLGVITLRAGPPGEIRYHVRARSGGADDAEARRRLEGFAISASRSGDRVLFRGESSRVTTGHGLAVEFDLIVPAGTSQIEATTGAGDISAIGFDGRLVLLTHGGRITADRLGGALRAESGGGEVNVGSAAAEVRLLTAGGNLRIGLAGGDVVAQSSGGDVSIDEARGTVRVETGGGSISVRKASRDVDVGTSGGNIDLGAVGGRVSAATSGGSIRIGSAGGGVRCETGAGPISIRGAAGPVRAVTSSGAIRAELGGGPGALADSDLQTWLGEVTVVLPEGLPATIRALIDDPAGHRIRSDFPLRISREAEGSGRPTEIGEGRVAGGGSLIKIRALGGDIVILRSRKTP